MNVTIREPALINKKIYNFGTIAKFECARYKFNNEQIQFFVVYSAIYPSRFLLDSDVSSCRLHFFDKRVLKLLIAIQLQLPLILDCIMQHFVHILKVCIYTSSTRALQHLKSIRVMKINFGFEFQ